MIKNLKQPDIAIRTKSLRKSCEKLTPLKTGKKHLRQQKLLFALQEVSKVLTAEVDLQKILADMATIVAKSLGAKWVNFWTLTPDKKALYIIAHHGMKPEYMEHSKRQPIALGKGWIGRAVKTGQPWGTSDIVKDPILLKDLGPQWKAMVRKQDYHGILCVPLISGKEKVGGICSYFVDPHEFTDFEMRLMMVAANQAATAIMNAKIFSELATERNKSIAMLNSLSDGLIMYDLNNKIITFSPRSEELLWVRRNEVFNKSILELPAENPLLKNIITISSLALGDFEAKDLLIEKPQRIFLRITQVPVRDSGDRKIGTMRLLHDITAEKEAEELKTRFVSIASHQLRTPLSHIKWIVDILLKGEVGELNSEQLEILKRVYTENELMINLIRDLLDVSRIEEGRFGYEFRLVDIKKIVQEIVQSFFQVAAQQNLHISIEETDKSLPLISADQEKLIIAIQNIIDNAVKYTLPTGSISINLHKGIETVIIDVKDTGIGIPREQQKFIFRKFFRAKNALLLRPEGSGLGLWIASEIIKRHNGRTYYDSEENKGSTFSIQLPINPSLMPRGKLEIEGR